MLFTTDQLVVIAAIALIGPAIACLSLGLHWLLRRPVPTTWVRLLAAITVSAGAVFWAYDMVLDRCA